MKTDPGLQRLQLEMSSNHSNIERAVNRAESFFGEWLDDEDLVYNLVLLTSEAVTNGMEHGNRFDESKRVFIEFVVCDSRIEISVEDEGPGFSREQVPDPLSDAKLFADGGRGLFLLESIADEVNYENEGRKTRVIFHRNSAHSSSE